MKYKIIITKPSYLSNVPTHQACPFGLQDLPGRHPNLKFGFN